MNTSVEYQIDIRNLKETEEGVEVYLFLQSLKNVYNVNEIIGTYICSKVKNIINNFRHKAKRAIYEELKANEIVSSKVNNIVATALKESNFEKLFEYYSGVSYDKEFIENIVPVCCKAIYNVHEKSCENYTENEIFPTIQNVDTVNSLPPSINVEINGSPGNKNTKRVFVEHLGDSHIIHLKTFDSVSSLKILLCKELDLKKDELKDTIIKCFSKETNNYIDLKSWVVLKSNENLRIFYPEDILKDIRPHIEVKDVISDIDARDPPKLTEHGFSTIQELVDDYKRSGGKLKWVEDFRLPKFDSKVSKRIEEGKIITATERTKICQLISESVKNLDPADITASEVQFILKCLFLTYPNLQNIEKDYWMAWNIWKVSLENMFEKHSKVDVKPNSDDASNSKSINAKRKSQTPVSVQKKKKQDERPIVAVNEELFNDNSSSNLEMVSAGMNVTFEERRMQIVSEGWSIEDIFVSYPWLYGENEIFAEFSRIVGFNCQVDKVIEAGFRRITEPLLYILKNHQKSRTVAEKEKELRTFEKRNKTSNFNYKMTLFALPLAIGEDVETIFKQSGSYYDEPIQIEFTGNEPYDNGKAYSVVLECCKIECSNLMKAVAIYFSSFFIFNLAYPSDIKKFMYAIERYILNIPGRAAAPTGVVKLFSRIDEFLSDKE